jgi:hypothetical protein
MQAPTHRPAVLLAATAALVLLSACAGPKPPREQMAVSRNAVDRAMSAASADAPPALAAARDHLAKAEAALKEKEYRDARRLAERAQADASLAESQARELRASRALGETPPLPATAPPPPRAPAVTLPVTPRPPQQ